MILWLVGRAGLHGPRLSVGLIYLHHQSQLRACRTAASRTPRAALWLAAEPLVRCRRRHILSDSSRPFLCENVINQSYLCDCLILAAVSAAPPRLRYIHMLRRWNRRGCLFQLSFIYAITLSVLLFLPQRRPLGEPPCCGCDGHRRGVRGRPALRVLGGDYHYSDYRGYNQRVSDCFEYISFHVRYSCLYVIICRLLLRMISSPRTMCWACLKQ